MLRAVPHPFHYLSLIGILSVSLICRRLLMEKLAVHVADFSPRLRSNTRALYQYLAIPAIRYPQLERELFCNIYYLRHLCDTQRYPDWPIKDPVRTPYILMYAFISMYQISEIFLFFPRLSC